ncbi:MAG: hypothetical protein ABL934_02795 [Lysobacteraceae bacterium]
MNRRWVHIRLAAVFGCFEREENMKSIKRTACLALLAASVLAGAVIAKPPPPPPAQPAVIYYFSDPARTQYVGRDVVTCEGLRYLEWGVRAAYSDTVPRDDCAS